MNNEMIRMAKLLDITPAGTDEEKTEQVVSAAISRIEWLKQDNRKVRTELHEANKDFVRAMSERIEYLHGMLIAAVKRGVITDEQLELIKNP